MSIAIPLSVGQESVCEILDFDTVYPIEISESVKNLNSALPSGMRVHSITIAGKKVSLIKWISFTALLEYDDLPDISELAAPFKSELLPVTKQTKRGEVTFDLLKNIKNVKFSTDGRSVTLSAWASCTDPAVNPMMLIDALLVKPTGVLIRRENIYDSNLIEFFGGE